MRPTDRLAALYTARALVPVSIGGPAAYSEVTSVSKGTHPGSLGVQVSVSSSKSQSTSEEQASTARGSVAMAGGNTALIATGSRDAAGQLIEGTGNLTATGAQISGNNVVMDAANDLTLRSAQSTLDQQSSNHSSGGSLGVGLTWGAQTGVTASVNGYQGRGKANTNTVEQLNTTVQATNTLSLQAGRDAILQGAQAKGQTVLADVGRNLTVTSVQDTVKEHSKQQQVSAGGSFLYGTGGSSASISQTQRQAQQDYASVGEQSGIFAGKGGFDVQVGGHTQLNGGAIASTAQVQANRLATGSLGYSNVENHSDASAKASGVSLGSEVIKNPIYAVGKSALGEHLASASDSQHETSTTAAVVSPGSISVRNGDASSVEGLRREIEGAHRKLDVTDLGSLQQKVDRNSQAGQLLSDIGEVIQDEGLRHFLGPKPYRAFCTQQPCTNDQIANTQRLEERAQVLAQEHPDWSAKKVSQQALSDLIGSEHNPNRDLDADQVDKLIAGELPLDAYLTAAPGARRVANVLEIPVDPKSLDKLSDDERKNSSVFGNGIFNDARRGAELALQMTPTERNQGLIQESGETYFNSTYLVHTDKTNFVGELGVAAVEKVFEILSSLTHGKITTPAAKIEADLAKGLSYNQKKNDYSLPLNLLGHSRGTMTETGAINFLGEVGYSNPYLAIYVNNPAAKESRLSAAAKEITDLPPVFWAPPNDPVAHFVGGYPGHVTFSEFRSMFGTSSSMHSSGGAAAVGSDPKNVNKDQLFSYAGLDIDAMNRKRQEKTIDLLKQWKQSPAQRQSGIGNMEVMQRVIEQSNQWQNQLKDAPVLLTPVVIPAVETGDARLQQFNQLRQYLNEGIKP